MRTSRFFAWPLAAALLASLTMMPGCGSANSDGIAYEGNEEAVRQHMAEVDAEERAHFESTVKAAKPEAQRVEEEERAQRSRN